MLAIILCSTLIITSVVGEVKTYKKISLSEEGELFYTEKGPKIYDSVLFILDDKYVGRLKYESNAWTIKTTVDKSKFDLTKPLIYKTVYSKDDEDIEQTHEVVPGYRRTIRAAHEFGGYPGFFPGYSQPPHHHQHFPHYDCDHGKNHFGHGHHHHHGHHGYSGKPSKDYGPPGFGFGHRPHAPGSHPQPNPLTPPFGQGNPNFGGGQGTTNRPPIYNTHNPVNPPISKLPPISVGVTSHSPFTSPEEATTVPNYDIDIRFGN